MSDWLQMSILAIVQGLTEFLPVSSSGHLVLAKELLGYEAMSGLGVELLLHAGTLVAVILYYRILILDVVKGLIRKDREAWRFACAILLSMIPALILGLTCESHLERLTGMPVFVCGALCFTGLLLLATRTFGKDCGRDVSPLRGVVMGLAQAVAMIPGISRSGSTIAMSRFLGISSEKAAAFSFLMVVPVIFGGTLLHVLKAFSDPAASAFEGLTWFTGVLGFTLSATVGYLSVAWMVQLLGRRNFWRFGFYCLALGLLGLGYFLFR